jgi:membrane fusion protein (multidrug efflux system)
MSVEPTPDAAATVPSSPVAPTAAQRRLLPRLVLLLMLVALGVGVAYYWLVFQYIESTDNAYVKANVTWVMPRVAGEVTALHVEENQHVTVGQSLLHLDDRDTQARVAQAQAMVQLKQATLAVQHQNEQSQQAAIREAQARLTAAQAESDRLSKEHQRYQSLLADGVTTRQRVETVVSQYLSAQAAVAQAQAAIAAAQAQYQAVLAARQQLHADLDSATANVALVNVDATSADVVAPVAGTVGSLAVRLGSRVTPQTRILAIVPLQSAYIEANFKETQIAKMRVGQQVEVHVDAYPDQVFQGHIASFSPASGAEFSLMPPDNATGNFNKVVQRLPVRIEIDNLNQRESLRAGLSASVRVDLRSGTAPAWHGR